MTLKVYEDQKAEMKGMWMLSFSSEFELGQFEQPLATRWKEIYQVRNRTKHPIPFVPLRFPSLHRLTSSSLRCWILLSRPEQNVV